MNAPHILVILFIVATSAWLLNYLLDKFITSFLALPSPDLVHAALRQREVNFTAINSRFQREENQWNQKEAELSRLLVEYKEFIKAILTIYYAGSQEPNTRLDHYKKLLASYQSVEPSPSITLGHLLLELEHEEPGFIIQLFYELAANQSKGISTNCTPPAIDAID